MILGSDDFNRADNASLGPYTEANGTWSIAANRAAVTGVSLASLRFDTLPTAGPDVKVSIRHISTSDDGGPIGRWNGDPINSGNSDAYLVDVWSGNWAIYKYVNGVQTTIASGSQALSANSDIRLEIEGTGGTVTLRAYYNGALLGSGNDTAGNRLVSAGYTGIVAWNASDWDNLLVEDFIDHAFEQEGFRWRNDDGSESAATWKQAQDVDASLAGDTPCRLRVLVNATGDAPSAEFELQYRKVGDSTWLKVQRG